jgi:hypothetical protein
LIKAREALEVTLDCMGALSKPHELFGHGLQEDDINGIFKTLKELEAENARLKDEVKMLQYGATVSYQAGIYDAELKGKADE